MPEYRVAQVRFSEDGKPYPVNARFPVTPGGFVIVRLDGKFTPLQKAQVVSVDDWKGPCQHSIVCTADKADAYGDGPDGISTEDDLDRFLTGFLNMTRHPVVQETAPYTKRYRPHPRWRLAYIRNKHLGDVKPTGYGRAAKLVVLGHEEITHTAPDAGQQFMMVNGALLADASSIGLPFTPETVDTLRDAKTLKPVVFGNIYRRAAHHAEGPLAVDRNPGPMW